MDPFNVFVHKNRHLVVEWNFGGGGEGGDLLMRVPLKMLFGYFGIGES